MINISDLFKTNLFSDVEATWETFTKDGNMPTKYQLAIQALFIPVSLSIKAPKLRYYCRFIYDFIRDLMSILTDDDKDNSSQFAKLIDHYQGVLLEMYAEQTVYQKQKGD